MNPTDKPFPPARRAEDGMPITAGYVPTGRESSEARARAAGEQPRPQPMPRDVIEALPRWARVAFVARCARRVLPLYRHFRPDATGEELRTLVEAVSIAEQAAASAKRGLDPVAAKHAAQYPHDFDAAYEACIERRHPTLLDSLPHPKDESPGGSKASRVVVIIREVFFTATWPDRSHGWVIDWWDEGDYVHISEAVYHLLLETAALGTVWNLASPSQDLAHLIRLAKEHGWTDDTPVPPEVFGPMWQGDPPSWWKDDVLAGRPLESSAPGTASDVTKPAAG